MEHEQHTKLLPMVATLGEARSNGKNYSDKKETIGRMILVAFDTAGAGRFHEVVDARWYASRTDKGTGAIMCTVWIRPNRASKDYSGSGVARGYGYEKKSAAFDSALTSAGVVLKRGDKISAADYGEGTVREAMIAIANAAGFEGMPMHIVGGY